MHDHRAVTATRERELDLPTNDTKALQTNASGLRKDAKSCCKRMHPDETGYSTITATQRRKYDLPALLGTQILYAVH